MAVSFPAFLSRWLGETPAAPAKAAQPVAKSVGPKQQSAPKETEVFYLHRVVVIPKRKESL